MFSLTGRVLYQARIHPQHPVQDLEDSQVAELHRFLRDVPLKACEVNADSALFPANWLFKWRWGKGGKKKKKAASSSNGEVKIEQPAFLALVSQAASFSTDVKPDGSPATITFVTVGGRTSAVVTELQKMPSKKAAAAKRKREATDGSDTETDEPPKQRRPRPKVKRKTVRVKKVCGDRTIFLLIPGIVSQCAQFPQRRGGASCQAYDPDTRPQTYGLEPRRPAHYHTLPYSHNAVDACGGERCFPSDSPLPPLPRR